MMCLTVSHLIQLLSPGPFQVFQCPQAHSQVFNVPRFIPSFSVFGRERALGQGRLTATIVVSSMFLIVQQ